MPAVLLLKSRSERHFANDRKSAPREIALFQKVKVKALSLEKHTDTAGPENQVNIDRQLSSKCPLRSYLASQKWDNSLLTYHLTQLGNGTSLYYRFPRKKTLEK